MTGVQTCALPIWKQVSDSQSSSSSSGLRRSRSLSSAAFGGGLGQIDFSCLNDRSRSPSSSTSSTLHNQCGHSSRWVYRPANSYEPHELGKVIFIMFGNLVYYNLFVCLFFFSRLTLLGYLYVLVVGLLHLRGNIRKTTWRASYSKCTQIREAWFCWFFQNL